MAGMEGLGRLFNVVPVIAGTTGIKMRNASAITFVATCTATGSTSTVAVTSSALFASGYAAALVIKDIYTTTALNGTAVWTKQTFNPAVVPWSAASPVGPASGFTFSNAANTFATALCCVFSVFTSQLTDPNSYIMATNTGGTGAALFTIAHDLLSQRAPANLELLAS